MTFGCICVLSSYKNNTPTIQRRGVMESHSGKDYPEDNTNTSNTNKMNEMPIKETKKKRKRRPPLVPWKKPKDMPRRPLSAYNIFFKEQREIMMNAAASGEGGGAVAADQSGSGSGGKGGRGKRKSNKSVGIGFANLARTIAANWKDLDDETRAPYEERAKAEKDRYNAEMLVWRAKQKEEKERAEQQNKGSSPRDNDSSSSPSATGVAARMDFDLLSPPTTMSSASAASQQRGAPSMAASASASTPFAASAAAGRGQDDDPIPLESPKKTRLGYLQHQQQQQQMMGHQQGSNFSPIHQLSNMMGTGLRPPMTEPLQQFAPTSNLNQTAGLTGTGLGLGMNTMPTTTGFGGLGGGGLGGQSSHHGLGTAGLGSHQQSFASNMMPTSMNGGAFQSFHDSWPSMMPPGSMGMNMAALPNFQLDTNTQLQYLGRSSTPSHLTPGQLLQQHQQQQQERRNTWSGLSSSNADLLGVRQHHQQALRRNTDRITGNQTFPSSWFEDNQPVEPNVEEERQRPSSKTGAPQPKPSSTKSYPETWFEVQDNADTPDNSDHQDDEPIRYSPEGDLTGKLPARQPNRREFPTLPSLQTKAVGGVEKNNASLKDGSGRSSKPEEEKQQLGNIRSLEELASDVKMRDYRRKSSTSAVAAAAHMDTSQQSTSSAAIPTIRATASSATATNADGNPVVESSLAALGMQLDDETVDFLTKLRFSAGNLNNQDQEGRD